MKNFGLKFHHLGLATDNPKLTLKILQNIGYKATKTRSNKNYNVKNIICTSKSHPTIEIVAKMGGKSPIDDIVNAIKILLKNKQKGVFNICSSREILLSDIARKLNFKQKNLFFDNAKSSTKIVGSNKKLRSLKWKPSYKNYLNYISKYKKY